MKAFNAAVSRAARRHRNGLRMGTAAAEVAEETGFDVRELAQALAKRSHVVQRAKARRGKVADLFSRDIAAERYRQASRGS